MKKQIHYSISIVILCSALASAQNPVFHWGKSVGSSGWDISFSVCKDINNNVYSTGYFSGTADFDPGTGIFNMSAVGGSDCFIQKLDDKGNLLWAVQNGGNDNISGNEITTDLQGNVYIIGEFKGTVDFDPGPGIQAITSMFSRDIYVQKLDSNGSLVWLKHMKGTGDDQAFDLTLDANHNIYIIGSFDDTVDFNPANGIEYNLVSRGAHDVFVQKLDSNGTFIWAKQMGGKEDDQGTAIVIDNNGDLIISGRFADTADYNPGSGVFNLISNGDYDAFVVKFNSSGGFLWANQIGGNTPDSECSISIDAVNNIYLTSSFTGTVDLDPGTGVSNYTSLGNYDIYVQKLSPGGNLIWNKVISSSTYEHAYSIHSDSNGNLYITGAFIGTLDFDPGTGTDLKTSLGQEDVFILRLSTDGNYKGVNHFGGSGIDIGFDIEADENGNIYTVGLFQNVVDFDPGVGVSNLTSAGFYDAFIHKMGSEDMLNKTDETSLSHNILVYPNPSKDVLMLEFQEPLVEANIKLFTLSGKQIFEKSFQNQQKVQFNIDQPSGVYLLEIHDLKGFKSVHKIIKE